MGLKEAAARTDFSLREVFARMHTALIIPFSNIIEFFGIGDGDLPRGKSGAAGFMGKVIAANLATSTIQSLGLTLEAVAAEAMFILGKFWYYKFLINPTNFKMAHAKLQSIQETSDLTVINTYRNTAPTISFSGVSGCILPRNLMTLADTTTKLPTETITRYPKLSTAYLKFRQLEKFYNETNSDIVIMYDMDLYVGKFVSFNYSQDANNPWVINYDMQIKVYPEMILHTTSIYDYKPFFAAMLDRYGKSFSGDFEGKSKRGSGLLNA